MRCLALLALLAFGCLPPSQYQVVRPGLQCERATRVAYRTMAQIGYTVTDLVEATPERAGQVVGSKPGPDGDPETRRVLIRCDGTGAVLQPVEDDLFPTYEFSREFGYSFKSLVQRPDVEVPTAGRGLEVLVHQVAPYEAVLDLGGSPTGAGAVVVRVTVRNHTDRAVAIDPAELQLVPAESAGSTPLAGAALDAAIAPGAAGERVRAELWKKARIAPNSTTTGFLVYPAARYREAQLAVIDVETEETEGFVTPVQ